MRARGLVLIILDTLRADFETLAAEAGVTLPNLGRLRALCRLFPIARCGSFPTGPMRTDLLTGRLAFLDAEWALPNPGEETLPTSLRREGFWTTLVTDNYVAAIPRLGGMLIDLFETVDFQRGAGSDPWATPSPELVRAARAGPADRASRSLNFEVQFLANVRAWASREGPPSARVFASAIRHLDLLERHERFLLWVDSFAFHEPWDLTESNALPELPLFPAYREAGLCEPPFLDRWKRLYVERLRAVDLEMEALVDRVEALVAKGDVALAVLSDHGFLFGEFGFVGKPPNTPLPPQLHDIICWLSEHFRPLATPTTSGLQPHAIHGLIRGLFGLPYLPSTDGIRLFGRNSPRSRFLAAVFADQLVIGQKIASDGGRFSVAKLRDLDPARLLACQGSPGLSQSLARALMRPMARGSGAWLAPFREALLAGLARSISNAERRPFEEGR